MLVLFRPHVLGPSLSYLRRYARSDHRNWAKARVVLPSRPIWQTPGPPSTLSAPKSRAFDLSRKPQVSRPAATRYSLVAIALTQLERWEEIVSPRKEQCSGPRDGGVSRISWPRKKLSWITSRLVAGCVEDAYGWK